MLVQKIGIFGVLIAVIIVVVLTLLITNSIQNTKSSLLSSPPTITAVAETLVNSTNSYNSTNNTSQLLHHPENLTLSPYTHHPPLPAPKNKSLSEQPQENRLRGPPLPSSSEPIRGPVPGTASP
jgi:hypothetical protein